MTNLEQLLDVIDRRAVKGERVSLDEIFSAVGRRSFGPLLLVAGLITVAPVISGIPGVPTLMAALVLLTAGQLLFRREHFWLPRWLLARSLSRDKLCKALKWLRPPARFIDRWLRPRLTVLTGGAGSYVIALVCTVIALAMPATEFVPFSGNIPGIVLTLFGLSLVAHDGVPALLALVTAGFAAGVVTYQLL